MSADEELVYERIRQSPRYFIEEILGDKLDDQQIPIVEAFPTARRIAVKSGHSCFGRGSRILMFDGSMKAVEDVAVGDVVMGDDSTPRHVQELYRGTAPLYRVIYSDGMEYIHNGGHRLLLAPKKSEVLQEVTVDEFLTWSAKRKHRSYALRAPVLSLPERALPIPPYIFGVWLGDGCHSTPDFCFIDPELIAALVEYAHSLGCSVRPNRNGRNWWISSLRTGGVRQHPFIGILKSLGVWKNKHVPDIYLKASRQQRLELLAGLIDTDGSINRSSGSYEFTQKRKQISESVVWLAQSLGVHASMSLRHVSARFKSGHTKEGDYWRVYIGPGLEDLPCRIERKKPVPPKKNGLRRVSIKSVVPIGDGEYFGFLLDGNHRFLTGECIISSNCGKDWLAGRLALWFHVAHYPSIVVTTGPTDRQVKLATWGEIRAAYKKSKLPIGGEILPENCKLRSYDSAGHIEPHHYMVGYTSDEPDAFQGIHTDNVLIIVTEAQGINPTLWPAIESLMTAGKAQLLLIGNALYEPESEFYAAFSSKATMYSQFTLDSIKSSHCSREYINEMREAYGEESPVWLARVKGIFPTDIADTLIPLGWIERARARWGSASEEGLRTLGVDVARFGSDLTVFVSGKGERFKVHDWKQGQDLMQTAGKVISYGRELGVADPDIRIDDTGLGGGVTDRVKEQGHKVTAINFGSKSTDEETYADSRSEIHWLLRERFRSGTIAIDPQDAKMLRDLSVLRYKMTSKGQIKMEPKAEIKKRLGASPDRADAIALAAIPPTIARDLGIGGKPSMGLLDYMKEKAEALKKGKLEPVASRPATEIPGAAQVIGNVSHERTEVPVVPVPDRQRV